MLRIPFRLLANMWRLVTTCWSLALTAFIRRLRKRQPVFVTFTLQKSHALAATEPTGLQRLFRQDQDLTLLELREAMTQVGGDDTIDGVILRIKSVQMGYAHVQDLIDMFDALTRAGKRVVMHVDSASQREMLLMSAATDRLITPAGRLYFFGMRFEEIFLHDLIDKLGVKAQFVHIGDFKTATHRFHKAHMTRPQRLMMQSLQRGLIDQFASRYARHGDITREDLDEAMDRAPLTPDEARACNLLTGIALGEHLDSWLVGSSLPEEEQRSEIAALPAPRHMHEDLYNLLENKENHTKEPHPPKGSKPPRPPVTVPLDTYMATLHEPYRWRPLIRKPSYIGLLDLNGAILMGDEGPRPPLGGGGASIMASEVIPRIKQLREDPRCAGVLLHMNSPGGSALASDLMWFELKMLAIEKPLVCYCSNVAASGGYYLASAAQEIICQPNTITGSIGVIVGKVALGGLLEKLDVHTDAVEQHPNSSFTSAFEPLDAPTLAALVEDARDFYARFLDRVGQARHIHRERLHRFARGRVYLGDEAHRRGLVDGLGGLEQAIARIHALTGLIEERTELRFVPHHKQSLRELASGSLSMKTRSKNLLDTALPIVEQANLALWLDQEPMLAILPWRADAITNQASW